MQYREQLALLDRMFHYIDTKSTYAHPVDFQNPVRDYVDAEVAAQEKRVLFREQPLLVGFSCQLPRPGDYLTAGTPELPLLLVRGQDHEVHAFFNVCRHRGTLLVREETSTENVSRAPIFTCPYHGWSYNWEGQLVGVPEAHGFAEDIRRTHSLKPLPVLEQAGLIWVRPDLQGGPIVDPLPAALLSEIETYSLQSYHPFHRRTVERRMNWKLVHDTFLEAYHIKVLHKRTIADFFYKNTNTFDAFGPHSRFCLPRKNIESIRHRAREAWSLWPYATVVYPIFPHTALLYQQDHMQVFQIYPGARPETSRYTMTLLVPEEPRSAQEVKHWQGHLDVLLRTTEEDFTLGEQIQTNCESGANEFFTYGRFEAGLTHQHSTRLAMLTADARAAALPMGSPGHLV